MEFGITTSRSISVSVSGYLSVRLELSCSLIWRLPFRVGQGSIRLDRRSRGRV